MSLNVLHAQLQPRQNSRFIFGFLIPLTHLLRIIDISISTIWICKPIWVRLPCVHTCVCVCIYHGILHTLLCKYVCVCLRIFVSLCFVHLVDVCIFADCNFFAFNHALSLFLFLFLHYVNIIFFIFCLAYYTHLCHVVPFSALFLLNKNVSIVAVVAHARALVHCSLQFV